MCFHTIISLQKDMVHVGDSLVHYVEINVFCSVENKAWSWILLEFQMHFFCLIFGEVLNSWKLFA